MMGLKEKYGKLTMGVSLERTPLNWSSLMRPRPVLMLRGEIVNMRLVHKRSCKKEKLASGRARCPERLIVAHQQAFES